MHYSLKDSTVQMSKIIDHLDYLKVYQINTSGTHRIESTQPFLMGYLICVWFIPLRRLSSLWRFAIISVSTHAVGSVDASFY